MKNTILIFGLLIVTLGSYGQTKQTIKPTTAVKSAASKFGALAIDRRNGFYYGWSYDYSTLVEAEQKAVEECKKKGGNCTVVLSYSGAGCAVYRTIDGKVGTAYGWGVAKTKEEADLIATKECLKRSNGTNPNNFVWSCNSGNTGTIKEIYNASEEIEESIKIGSQYWSSKNLSVTKFKNGDPILLATDNAMWKEANDARKPACRYLEDRKENKNSLGLLYNWYAVNDPRGLAPEGYLIPSKEDWQTLINVIGDYPTLAGKLKSKTGWEKLNGTDDFGFNAIPSGNVTGGGAFYGKDGFCGFWSTTPSDDTYIYVFPIYGFSQNFDKFSRIPRTTGMSVRCLIKNN